VFRYCRNPGYFVVRHTYQAEVGLRLHPGRESRSISVRLHGSSLRAIRGKVLSVNQNSAHIESIMLEITSAH